MAKAKVSAKAQPKSKASVKKPVKKLPAKAKPQKKAVSKPAPKNKVTNKVVKPAIKKTAAKPAVKAAVKKAPTVKKATNNNATISKQLTKPVSKTVTPAKSAPKATANKNKKVKLPEGYKPSDKEEYMSPAQLEYFRQKLVAWQDELKLELSNTLNNLKEENWQEPDITDRATVEIDTGLELRTRDRYRKLLNKIDAALFRIERGEYGYCEETGEEIGIKRLQARPIATLSVEAQERHERDERTHYDEDMEDRA